MSPRASTRLLATQSDERLVVLARSGHERAFEALVQRYRRPLLRYCRRLPLSDARAEDVVQQALIQAWMALRRGAEVRDLRTWLYRITHNAAIDAVREGVREQGRLTEEPEPSTPASDSGRTVLREALAGIAALPEMQREVIFRTAVVGYSHEEVAYALGISDGAVRGLLYRARASLRAAITAFTPPPLLVWAAGGTVPGPASERLGELAAGGGGVGLGGLLLKGGVAAITAGTLIGGAALVHNALPGQHAHHRHRAAAAAPTAAVATRRAPSGVAADTTSSGVARARGRGHRNGHHLASSSHTAGSPLAFSHSGPSITRGTHRPGSTAPTPRSSTPTPTNTTSTTVTVDAPSSSGGGAASTGSAASAGEAPGSSTPSGGEGGSSPPPSGGGEGGGSGSGGSGSGGSGSGSGGSGSGGGGTGSEANESGGLVGTVVHEVAGLVEGTLKGVLH